MDQLASVISSVSSLVWPLLFLVLIVMFGPALRDLISTLKQRKFSVNVGGTQVTVDEATEQQRRLISDLQEKVLQLERERPQAPVSSSRDHELSLDSPMAYRADDQRPVVAPSRVLWVDDY